MSYGAGARSDYRFAALEAAASWRAEFTHAGVHEDGALPRDSFTRLRDGAELRHRLAWPSSRRAGALPQAMTDICFNAPSGPASGIAARTALVLGQPFKRGSVQGSPGTVAVRAAGSTRRTLVR